ncbi:hypothetical protein F5148DRAFT_979366 [Russula earlei]|uniref:Uncharacterized protein n=1 Tax=Russula earlei TaxID=71964 RepID=A0ACC0UBE3_9AGAM|nr:hypothetical protein F5148DRAFT_979366 [Russula earlei]
MIPPGPLLCYYFLCSYPEHTLRAWSRIYGPLFSIWMGNQLFVMISNARIDLLVNNGAMQMMFPLQVTASMDCHAATFPQGHPRILLCLSL